MAKTCWRRTGDGQRVMFRFTRAGEDRHGRQQYLTYVYVKRDGLDRVLFAGGPYTPSPMRADDTRTWVSDVVGFAAAYVERPGEFDRESSDKEQLEAAWWRTNGDSLACSE